MTDASHLHDDQPDRQQPRRRVPASPAEKSPAPAVTGDPGGLLGLQRAAGNAAVRHLVEGEAADTGEERSPVKDVVARGGGDPLPVPVRHHLESRLGDDFGDVRVHTDAQATESAKAVQAHAYTVGNDVVVQGDRYAPDTPGGLRMLAHELTHVTQQRSGPVEGSPAPGGIRISHPGDRFERAAEEAADRVVGRDGTPARPEAAPPSLQRQAEEEEDVQALALQRQGEEEEEVQPLALQRQEEEEEAEA